MKWMLSSWYECCFWSSFLIEIKRNAFAKSVATCQVLEVIFICSGSETMSGMVAAIRACTELAAVYSHSPGSICFLQGPDWWINQKYGRDHYPCILEILKSGTDLYLPSKMGYGFFKCTVLSGEQRSGKRHTVSEVSVCPSPLWKLLSHKPRPNVGASPTTKYISISATHSETGAMTTRWSHGPSRPIWRWCQPGLHFDLAHVPALPGVCVGAGGVHNDILGLSIAVSFQTLYPVGYPPPPPKTTT